MTEHFQAKRVLSYLFILGITFLFALQWGPGSQGCQRSQTNEKVAATVNGKDIPLNEFQRAYAGRMNYLRQMGNPIPESVARQFGLHTQVLNQLVDLELLAQAAERNKIAASDAEVLEVLKKNPDFQKDGKFDLDHYKMVVKDYYRKTYVAYENDLRRQLAAEKMLDLVAAAAAVSDDEVKAKFLKEGNKANVTFARFLPAMYADKVGQLKEAEVAAWAKEHPKELADYYEANKLSYHQPERVRARHILVKVTKDAPAVQQDAAKKKIEQIRKEIEGGKDFAAAAKEHSEDEGSKVNGGDLGLSERGAWVPEFSEAAFALKPGEMSQPVVSPFGVHLIKVEEKKAPEKKELKEVELEIARTLLAKERAKELARAEAQKTLAAVKGGKKLAELHPKAPDAEDPNNPMARFAAETKPQATETGEFNASLDSMPQLGINPEVHKAVFAAEGPAILDQVFTSGEGFVVVTVTDRKRPNDEELAAQKETLRADAIKAKQMELRDAFVKSLKKSGSVVINDAAVNQSLEG